MKVKDQAWESMDLPRLLRMDWRLPPRGNFEKAIANEMILKRL